jgi:hypothetical protein
MIDQPDFMPVLAPRRDDQRLLTRPLVPGAGSADDRSIPLVVSFGTPATGTGDARLLTVEDAVRRRLSVEGAEHIARRHLVDRAGRPGWTTLRSATGTWIERRGDDHVAADILDAELLQEAHRLLATNDLLAAVPARGVMLVAPLPLADLIGTLARLVHAEAQRTDRGALAPVLFAVRNGELLGVHRPAGAPPARSAPVPAPVADDVPSPEARDGSAVFGLNCLTVDEVEALARRCLDRHLPALVRQEWFKGVVIFSVNGYMMPGTDANKVALQELNEKLDESTSWKSLTTRGGKAVTVRLRLDA